MMVLHFIVFCVSFHNLSCCFRFMHTLMSIIALFLCSICSSFSYFFLFSFVSSRYLLFVSSLPASLFIMVKKKSVVKKKRSARKKKIAKKSIQKKKISKKIVKKKVSKKIVKKKVSKKIVKKKVLKRKSLSKKKKSAKGKSFKKKVVKRKIAKVKIAKRKSVSKKKKSVKRKSSKKKLVKSKTASKIRKVLPRKSLAKKRQFSSPSSVSARKRFRSSVSSAARLIELSDLPPRFAGPFRFPGVVYFVSSDSGLPGSLERSLLLYIGGDNGVAHTCIVKLARGVSTSVRKGDSILVSARSTTSSLDSSTRCTVHVEPHPGDSIVGIPNLVFPPIISDDVVRIENAIANANQRQPARVTTGGTIIHVEAGRGSRPHIVKVVVGREVIKHTFQSREDVRELRVGSKLLSFEGLPMYYRGELNIRCKYPVVGPPSSLTPAESALVDAVPDFESKVRHADELSHGGLGSARLRVQRFGEENDNGKLYLIRNLLAAETNLIRASVPGPCGRVSWTLEHGQVFKTAVFREGGISLFGCTSAQWGSKLIHERRALLDSICGRVFDVLVTMKPNTDVQYGGRADVFVLQARLV